MLVEKLTTHFYRLKLAAEIYSIYSIVSIDFFAFYPLLTQHSTYLMGKPTY